MLVLNTAYGRFCNGFEVAIEGDELVFMFDGSQADDAPIEGGDAFLRLANLVKPAGAFAIKTTRVVPGPSGFSAFIDDIDYSYVDAGEVLQLAREFGPLFRHACADDGVDVVREPLEAWYAAARVLNFAVRAEATLADPPRASEGALDGEVVYMVEQNCSGIHVPKPAISWAAAKGFAVRFPSCTARCSMFPLPCSSARTIPSRSTMAGSRSDGGQAMLASPCTDASRRPASRAWSARRS